MEPDGHYCRKYLRGNPPGLFTVHDIVMVMVSNDFCQLESHERNEYRRRELERAAKVENCNHAWMAIFRGTALHFEMNGTQQQFVNGANRIYKLILKS